jgi:hypothetical protein
MLWSRLGEAWQGGGRVPGPDSGEPSPAALREKFELFLFELDDALMGLRAQVAAFDLPELLPLDGTPESLDRLERAYDLVLDGDVRSGDLDVFATRVARYLGEALRRDVGGHWRLCMERRNVAYGLPWITELPNLGGFGWCPLLVVFNYRHGRRRGLFRRSLQPIMAAAKPAAR